MHAGRATDTSSITPSYVSGGSTTPLLGTTIGDSFDATVRANPDRLERSDSLGRPAEEERLPADTLGRSPPAREAALEVAQNDIAGTAELAHLGRPEVLGGHLVEPPGNGAPEHHVSEQADRGSHSTDARLTRAAPRNGIGPRGT